VSVRLENRLTRADLLPDRGARVQHLVDLVSGRDLLYQRDPEPGSTFLATSTGGWDEMFPNDDPWNGFPDHGTVWSTAFDVATKGPSRCTLVATVELPAVDLVRDCALLDPPRRGLRVETTVTARLPTGHFLWCSHPMLAVEPGWRSSFTGSTAFARDSVLPGRVPAAGVPPQQPTVPDRNLGWSEVVYATGCTRARIGSPDESRVTEISWDPAFFRHLWVTTVTGEVGIDLCVLLEPSTTRPYRMSEAVPSGDAMRLAAGERVSFWVEVESRDGVRL
jgi:hypothetical protein